MAPRKKLGEILIEAGVIDELKLKTALGEQRRWGGPLGKILIEMGVSETVMVQALAAQLNFPVVDLDHTQVSPEVLELISPELAEQHGVIPFARQGKFLDVAMADPRSLDVTDELRIKTKLNVRPHLAGPRMIERALARHYHRGIEYTGGGMPQNTSMREFESNAAPGVARPKRESQGVSEAAMRRSAGFDNLIGETSSIGDEPSETKLLERRLAHLEALVARDEDVLRKLIAFIIDKGVCTRDEILGYLAQK
jgi:hypothetical protein